MEISLDRQVILHCPFCQYGLNRSFEFKDVFGLGRSPLLYKNELYVICDIAPLQVGHLLIVTGRHFQSIADYLNVSESQEFSSIKQHIRLFHNYLGFESTIFFEHGSCGIGSSSSCIDHAHLHSIPVSDHKIWNDLQRELEQSADKIEINDPTDNYLYIECGESRLYFQDVHEKQYLRFVISEIQGNRERHIWQKYISGELKVVAKRLIKETQKKWYAFETP